MLKKIQEVWSNILKNKKIANSVNLYSIKNNFMFTSAITNSLVFFITSLNKTKLVNLKIIDKTQFLLNYYKLFILFSSLVVFSFITYILFLV